MNIFGGLIIAFFLVTPVVLTLINIFLLFHSKVLTAKWVAVTDGMTMILGVSFSALLFANCNFIEWNQPLVIGDMGTMDLHTPVSFEHMPTFFAFCIIALAGYAILRIGKDKLPPLAASVCISGIFTGILLCIVWGIQLAKNLNEYVLIFLLVFLFNYILCSIRLLRGVLSLYARKADETTYNNRLLQFCNSLIKRIPGLLLVSFVLILPILCVVIVILLLFGQTPDGFIKMFTSTADWTLSQQIPPPPIEYEGHYLCTVAAGGDEKVVKPLRIGIRQNTKIIVNRQLCVANAFEDLLKEKLPRFHKAVRRVYDTCGYPLSRHITTRKRANAVYRFMKPLEWLFLVILYAFDQKPENRIAIQYTAEKTQPEIPA